MHALKKINCVQVYVRYESLVGEFAICCVVCVCGGGGVQGDGGVQKSKNKTFSIFIIIIAIMFDYTSCFNSTQINIYKKKCQLLHL